MKRTAIAGLLLAGAACARNNSDDAEVGAARDSTTVSSDSTIRTQVDSGVTSDSTIRTRIDSGVTSDSASNQTESGVTDSSGRSTLGPGAQQTRPDQGQPVTAKGDTVNSGVDSSTTPR